MLKFPITCARDFRQLLTRINDLVEWARNSTHVRDSWTAGMAPYEAFDDPANINVAISLRSDPRVGPSLIIHNLCHALPEHDFVLDLEAVLEIMDGEKDPFIVQAKRWIRGGFGYTDGDGNTWRATDLDEEDQILTLVCVDGPDASVIGQFNAEPLHAIFVGPNADRIKWGRLTTTVNHISV